MFSSAEPEYRSYPLAADTSPFSLSPRGGLVRRIGKRPGFLAYAKNYLLPPGAGINYCHSISFESMVTTILTVVNRAWGMRWYVLTMKWFLDCQTNLLLLQLLFITYPPATNADLVNQETASNQCALQLYNHIFPAVLPTPPPNMLQPINAFAVLTQAKALISHHFSALTNLRLGDRRWNIGLQDKFDPIEWFYWSGTELRFAQNMVTPSAVGAGTAAPAGLPAPIGWGFYYSNPTDCMRISYACTIGRYLYSRAGYYTDPATNVTCAALYSSSNASPFIPGLPIVPLQIRYYLNPITGGWIAF